MGNLAIVAMLLGNCGADPAQEAASIQGIWRGVQSAEGYALIFCDDVLIGRRGTHPITGATVSGFRVGTEPGTIDIERDDGLQLGRYAIEGDKLTMMLAKVNDPRPTSVDFPKLKLTSGTIRIDRKTWKPRTEQRFVFERVR